MSTASGYVGDFVSSAALAARHPASLNAGRTATVTSGGTATLYFSNGSSWSSVGSGGTSNQLDASTIANLPSAAANSGKWLFCTNYGPNGTYLASNGTRWKPMSGSALLYSLVTPVVISSTSETSVGVISLPPSGLLRAGDKLRHRITAFKNGTTDAFTLAFTLGTNSDGVSNIDICTPTPALTAANQSLGSLVDYRFETNTTIQKLGSASTFTQPYNGGSNSAGPVAVTIDDISSSTQLYLCLTALMGGSTNTTTVVDWTVELLAGPV